MEVYNLIPDTEQDKDYKPVETLTDVFNKVVSHLLTQNKTSAEYGGSCKYRTFREDDTTLKCAVGCLISDSVYFEDLEDQMANASDVIKAIQDSNPNFIVTDEIKEMMLQLQFLHDHCQENIWFYMAFLIYRDFNLLLRQSFSNDLMPVINNTFPDTHINQRNMYVFLASNMEKSELIPSSEGMPKVATLKEEYLNILNSNKVDKETPFAFFKRKQSAFSNLIVDKVITTTHY